MSKSAIEWTEETWNPIAGCRRVSPGCGGAKGVGGCYAEKIAMRFSQAKGKSGDRFRLVVRTDESGKPTGWNGRYVEIPEKLAEPLRRRKPTCYFVNSMSDLFGEGVSDEYIAAVFGVMAATPQHIYQVLTKRAERMAAWFERVAGQVAMGNGSSGRHLCVATAEKRVNRSLGCADGWPLPNVWIGTSVEDQQRADERIPHLLRVPAAVRFLSVEPMLGAINLAPWLYGNCHKHGRRADLCCRKYTTTAAPLHWVIVGGESGHGARPFDVAWARSIVAQCKAAQVPVFVKQLGANPRPDVSDEFPLAEHSARAIDDSRHLLAMKNRKGGDIAEWPADLRVRQWPVIGRMA